MFENVLEVIMAPPHTIKIVGGSILLTALTIGFYFACKKRKNSAYLQNAPDHFNGQNFNLQPPMRGRNTKQDKKRFVENYRPFLNKLMESCKLPSRKAGYMAKSQNFEIA